MKHTKKDLAQLQKNYKEYQQIKQSHERIIEEVRKQHGRIIPEPEPDVIDKFLLSLKDQFMAFLVALEGKEDEHGSTSHHDPT